MRLTSIQPNRPRRIFGYFIGVFGLAILVGVIVYFSPNVILLTDIVALLFGGFVALLGGVLCFVAMFLAASGAFARRVGCIGALTLGVPFMLLLVFLVWSLFQTTKPALDSETPSSRKYSGRSSAVSQTAA